MCYGQTGAGKTYTMTGATENYKHRGILPRALQQVASGWWVGASLYCRHGQTPRGQTIRESRVQASKELHSVWVRGCAFTCLWAGGEGATCISASGNRGQVSDQFLPVLSPVSSFLKEIVRQAD